MADDKSFWSNVRASDVAKVLVPADVLKARIFGRLVIGVTVLVAVGLHFFAPLVATGPDVPTGPGSPPGAGGANPQTVEIALAIVAFVSVLGLVRYLTARRGLVPKMPPLPAAPAGSLDHEAVRPFLTRSTLARLVRAAGVSLPVLTGAIVHVLFRLDHVPLTAPADLAALAPVAFGALYFLAAGSSRKRLAADVARDIARVVARVERSADAPKA